MTFLRMLMLLAILFACSAGPSQPTDVDALNAFAKQYNLYAEQLRAGQIDIKQWQRVVRAWNRLTK